MSELRLRPAWRALEKHDEQVRGLHLRDLFAEDPERGERLVAEGAGLRDGHDCVVYDVSADAVAELEREGATGTTTLEDEGGRRDG